MVDFEDERHIEIIMDLVQQIDKARSFIKEKDILINKLETKVHNFE